jgi:zinc transport system substrate-binding protein
MRHSEGVGFEPTKRFHVYTLSKRAPSATRTSLHKKTQFSLANPLISNNQKFAPFSFEVLGEYLPSYMILNKLNGTQMVSILLRFVLACSFLLTVGSCAKKTSIQPKKPLLLVSIAPYRYLTERIAGPEFEVQTVVPSAANPHSFEPTSSQVTGLIRGQAWFRIGEPFEGKMIPILKARNPNLQITDLRDGIDLIKEQHDSGCTHCSIDHLDRHIWLSPKLAKEQAALIEQALSFQFPSQKETFKANLEQLSLELANLDQEIRDILKPVTKRTLVVSHPAFGYFCKEYNFTQLSIEHEGKDPTANHLDQILKQAVMESAEIALALPQYNNKGAQLIAEKLHMPVRLIDPYSANYFETMRKLANTIAEP